MLVIILFFLLCIFTLTGCENHLSQFVSSDPATYTSTLQSETTTNPHEIVSFYSDVNFWTLPVWDLSDDTITGTITKETGLILDTIIPAQNSDTQLSLLLLNDELPDIISVTDETIISQLVTSGKVWNLEELFQTYAPDSWMLKSFPKDIKQELCKRDGGWYAFPSHMDSEDASALWPPSCQYYVNEIQYSDNTGILWNRSLLEEFGLSIENLQTEEDLLNAFSLARRMKPDITPILVDGADYQSSTLKFLEHSFGAEYLNTSGDYQDIILQPETKHALSFLNRLYRLGYIPPEQFTMENTVIKKLLASDRVLCFIGNIANTAIDPSKWISSGPVLSMNGEHPVLGKNRKSQTGWLSTFVSKSAPHPELIVKWFQYMTSKEGAILTTYGWENVDYYYDENGLLVQTNAGKERSDQFYDTGIFAWWMFHNFAWFRSIQAAPAPDSPDYLYQTLYNAYGKHEKTILYDSSAIVFHSSQLESQYEKIDISVQNYISQTLPLLLLSDSKDLFEAEYADFYHHLEAMGIHILDYQKNILMNNNCNSLGITMKKINLEQNNEENTK